MIVKELIEYLQTIDPELKVFVKGYEAGYNDVNTINHEDMVLNVNNIWYCLLYTSPSPRDRQKSRMPSSA